MNDSVEMRSFKRFKIPDSNVKFNKKGLLSKFSFFSQESPMINLGEGGISFYSKLKLDYDKKLIIQIFIPDESPLTLTGKVRWVGVENVNLGFPTGVEFDPFGKGINSEETLEVIKKPEKKYYTKIEQKFIY